jgi:cell division transport system permease protein
MGKKNNFHSSRSIKNIHFTSTFSMSLVLFLVGLVILLLLTARNLGVNVRENINLSIILDDEIKNTEIQRIQKYLLSSSYAKSVRFISKEEALEEHIKSLGEDPQKFLGYNPLLASFEVKLKAGYANNDSVEMIESKLKKIEHINRIAYQKDVVDLVNQNIQKLSYILLGIALVLLLVSMALINNTIRLLIYSNRFLINTMKLVGATWWFIRWPYIKQGMLNGLVASLLSLLYLAATIYYVQYEFGITGMVIPFGTAAMVSVIILFLGVALTGISSYLAVGRYLRMDTNNMYFV